MELAAEVCRLQTSVLAAMEFPMHVLPVEYLMTLDRLPTHEQVKDKLVVRTASNTVLFVSQTWLDYHHPDNAKNEKLKLLKHKPAEQVNEGDTLKGTHIA